MCIRGWKIGWAGALLGMAMVALCMTPSASAQTSLGGISGQVETLDKALVVGAEITVTNDDTKVAVRVKSGGGGVYSVSSLQPGTYTLTVVKQGFAEERIPGVNIDAGVTTSINVGLRVGEVSTVVEVQANAQLLSLDSATQTSVVDKETIVELPYPERSALEVATLAPGVNGDPQYVGGVQSENPDVTTQPNTPGASLSVAGGRPGSASQLIDGFDITLSGYPRAGVTFSKDSVHGVTVQQGFLQAQYGRNGGGIVNQASDAGGKKYHGVLEYRHEDPLLEARTQGVVSDPDRHQNLFTFAFSGPVPGTRRSPTFFYAAFEPTWAGDKRFSRRRVASPDELAGRLHNSSDLLDGGVLKNLGYQAALLAPRTNGIYNEFALCPQANNPYCNAALAGFPTQTRLASAGAYTHYANDDISALVGKNPVAQYLNSLQPTPSSNSPYIQFLSPDGNTYDSAGNNAFGVRAVSNFDSRYTARIDHQLNALNNMFVRYTVVPVSGHRYDYLGPDSIGDQIPTDNILSRNIAVSLVSVLGSNKVNESRISYLRSNRYRGPADQTLNEDTGARLGLVPAVSGVGFPTFSFGNGLSSIGSGGTETDGGRSLDVNFGLGDDFSWQKGRHSFKFGVDYRALQLNRTDDAGTHGGQYSFSAGISGSSVNAVCITAVAPTYQTNCPASGVASGSTIASFEMGFIGGYTFRQIVPFYYRWKYGAAYAQDDWRILPKVTLNVGLRYNVETPRMEKDNKQGVFLPDLQGVSPLVAGGVTGGFAFSGTNGLGRTLWPMEYLSFEPRVGLAYAPFQRVTVRTSYSLMHTPLTGVSNSVLPDLSGVQSTIGNTTGGALTGYVNYLTNPIATLTPPPLYLPQDAPLFTFAGQNSSSGMGNTISGTLPYVVQNKNVPYVQNWTLSLQYEFSRRSIVEASYVGNYGTHLFGPPVDTNVGPLAQIEAATLQGCSFSTSTATPQAAKVYGPNCVVPIKPYAAATQTLIQYLRPYPQFYNNVITNTYRRDAVSRYHALYVRVVERATKNLTLQGAFQWQKSQDNSSNGSVDGTATDSFGFAYPQQPYDLSGEYALSTYDQPVSFKAYGVYTLPFGYGQKYRSGSGWVNTLIGGFNIGSIFRTSSGVPLHVQENNSGFFVNTQDVNLRPNLVPGQPTIKANWKADPFGYNPGGGYVNAAAFYVPGSAGNPQFGDIQRTLGQTRTPRVITLDITLRKEFTIGGLERYHFQLYADAINADNHANYFQNTSLSAHSIGNAAFGNLGSASTGRIIGLGARVKF